jgi:hypothetical protein
MTPVNRAPGRKTQKPKPPRGVPKGFKVVLPPKNLERRRLMEGTDMTGSGGCRSVGREKA